MLSFFFQGLTTYYSWRFVVLTGLKLKSRSSQQRHPASLVNLIPAFFFDFPHSPGEKFSVFWSLLFAFLCDLLLHRVRQCLCYRTRGMIRCWIVGALVLDFLASSFNSFLTTDRWTSSSLEGIKSFQILSDSFQSSLGPQLLRHSCICQPKNILLFSYSKLRTLSNIHTASAKRFTLPSSGSPSSRTRMPLTQQQVPSAVGQDPLLHEETLPVISTPALDHTALWSPPRVPIGRYFCGHASHRKCGVCVCRPLQWAPHSQGLRRRYSVSSWHTQCVKNLGGSLTKRLISLFWVVVVMVPQSMRGGEGTTRWSWFSCSKAQA